METESNLLQKTNRNRKNSVLRLDDEVYKKGWVRSRSEAKAVILAGKILVNGHPVTHAGCSLSPEDQVSLGTPLTQYVSRGAQKLLHGLEEFKINVEKMTALDVGASTGGFTEVLLRSGAKKVYAVDVGHNQLDWKLRSDPRVKACEGINARHMGAQVVNEKIDVIVMDVSFISITKIIPNLIQFCHPKTVWITLIKPQFEGTRKEVGKGGIVSSDEVRRKIVERVVSKVEILGLKNLGLIESPIKGASKKGKGNQEFLALWRHLSISLSSE